MAEPRLGMATADNNQFLDFGNKIDYENIYLSAANREEAAASKVRWFPYNKGGEYRKWYGNNDYVVDWEDDGRRIRNFTDNNGKVLLFHKSIIWIIFLSPRLLGLH